jgi:hypothetical protein
MSIADTGRFWEILEDSRKYWLYQYYRYWKILENTGYTSIADTGRLGTKLRNVLAYCRILSSVATGLHFQSPALFRATNIIQKETK